ncbi:sulfate transporter family-domain-containing protein [Chytriomyces sp. MP71]|nr:sulfate transporter family-domain-containing protein [Chytriomyces sp. MP71]
MSSSPLLGGHSRGRHNTADRDGRIDEGDSAQGEGSWLSLARSTARTIHTRARYYVPVLAWLPTYNTSNLANDAIAGASVACLLIPQALSYAQAIIRIPPIYGLYTCFTPLVTYALLGNSRTLSVGPEALVSILVGAAVRERGFVSMQETIAVANLLAFLVGVFTFALGFFRLGFLDSVLSRALLRGFVTAVAFVVVIDQLPNLLAIGDPASPPIDSPSNAAVILDGLPIAPAADDHRSPIETLLHIIANLSKTHAPTATISAVSVVFLLAFKFYKALSYTPPSLKLIPEILILVASSTLLSATFRWDSSLGVSILKDVEGGFRAPSLPTGLTLSNIRYYVLSSILIAVIGFVESIVIGKTYATKHHYSVSPNRELVALGLSNLFGSLFGAWPAFGSLGRSAVNDAAGAKTQVAGLVTGFVVLGTMLYLLPLFYYLPKCVCSAIIVVAALKLIEWHDVEFLLRVQAWSDIGLLLLTFVTTLVVSIEVGTLISVGTSLLLVLDHTTKTRISILGRVRTVDTLTHEVKDKFRPISKQDAGVDGIDGILMLRLEEGLFFGNCGQLKERLKRVEMFGDLHVHPGEAPRTRQRQRTPSVSWRTGRGGRSREASVVPSDEAFFDGDHGGDDDDAYLESAISYGSESELQAVIFEVSAVGNIDASATQTLLEVVESYHARNITVCFVKLQPSCKPWFTRSGLIDIVGADHFFSKMSDALRFLSQTRLNAPTLEIRAATPEIPEQLPPVFLAEEEEEQYVNPRGMTSAVNPFTPGSWGSTAGETFRERGVSIGERLSRPSFVNGLGDAFQGGFVVDSVEASVQGSDAALAAQANGLRMPGRLRPSLREGSGQPGTSFIKDEIVEIVDDSDGEEEGAGRNGDNSESEWN